MMWHFNTPRPNNIRIWLRLQIFLCHEFRGSCYLWTLHCWSPAFLICWSPAFLIFPSYWWGDDQSVKLRIHWRFCKHVPLTTERSLQPHCIFHTSVFTSEYTELLLAYSKPWELLCPGKHLLRVRSSFIHFWSCSWLESHHGHPLTSA